MLLAESRSHKTFSWCPKMNAWLGAAHVLLESFGNGCTGLQAAGCFMFSQGWTSQGIEFAMLDIVWSVVGGRGIRYPLMFG
jgi:hypothetical protein